MPESGRVPEAEKMAETAGDGDSKVVEAGGPGRAADADGAASGLREAYDLVNRIRYEMDRTYSAAASRAGLSDSALDVLWSLHDLGEGCLQRDICAYSCLGKQTVSSSVHRLMEQGVLRLEPAATGKGTRVYLTERGRALLEERVAPICRADFDAFAELKPADREALVRAQQAYLDALNRRLGELPAFAAGIERPGDGPR